MLTIGVGQCGVQVSGEFWSQIHRESTIGKSGPSLPSISGATDAETGRSDPTLSKYVDDGIRSRAGDAAKRPTSHRTGDLFDHAGKARALFVDSEPKVQPVQELLPIFTV